MDFRQSARDASLWSVGGSWLGFRELILDVESCSHEEQDQSRFSESEEFTEAFT
jgi:hypothetical protein